MTSRPVSRSPLLGSAELRSRPFSNRWTLHYGGEPVALVVRFGRIHVSRVRFTDGTDWLLEPGGLGVVVALEGEREIARITRRSWFGRRWDVTGTGFAYELISRPAPRRWYLAIGGAEVAGLAGSPFSYNKVRFDSLLSVPVVAVLLAWHVVARPWEAAAEPRELIPVSGPDS